MLDYAIGFILGNIWSLCFLALAIYCYFYRQENKSMLQFALIFAGAYGLSQIVYAQFILPQKNVVEIYYLYWAGATSIVVASLYINHKFKGFHFYWPIKIAITLLLIEVLLNIALHIDRNIIALNGNMVPNNPYDNEWWLWGVRNMMINFDNIIILIAALFPLKTFQSDNSSFKHSNSSTQMDEAFKRIKILKDMVYVMPDGIQKSLAQQCITTAEFLLSQWNGEGEDRQHLYCANLLCDRARTLSLYVSDKVPEKLAQDEKRLVQ